MLLVSAKKQQQTLQLHTMATMLLLSLLLATTLVTVTATPTSATTTTTTATTATTNTTSNNYNCPIDCDCKLAQNTHKPHLHAKCTSTVSLKSTEPLAASLPIHSIDLSYLNLKRLAHALDKLPELTSIDLSHNELHEIGHLSRHVKKLNLKHNRLTSTKLHKLPKHLQVLNLQHNDITYLPREFKNLTNLMQLELSHNTINCSCETLDVRNWLQERNVYMEHPVVCSYPAETHGMSWLQVKQSDICEKEQRGWYTPEAEENELMLGDQPLLEDTTDGMTNDDDEEEDELGKAYLPIDDKKPIAKSNDNLSDDVEGSGDLSALNMPLNLAELPTQGPAELRAAPAASNETFTAEDDDDEEGSGSGGGLLIIPSIHHDTHIADDFDAPDNENKDDSASDDDSDNKPIAAPSPDIFPHMGIFDENAPVSEETIVPVVHKELNNAPTDGITDGIQTDVITDAPGKEGHEQESESILSANVKKDDSNATYFLLGVIGLIVLGLIVFVAMKRCKHNSNAARDAEAQRQTELLDMDKKNLGKPLQRNGNGTEHIPLIGEKTKLDEAKPVNGTGKKPYDSADTKDGVNQQLLNGNGTNGKDAQADGTLPTINEPASDPHQYYPITPRYPTPQSPRASKYAQHGEQNNNDPDASYLPSSPKSGRYSPVYSPETGRVKIKLTETPKPKTPMLVTRSKSNAGDIITTPVHQLSVGGVAVGGGANGHVV